MKKAALVLGLILLTQGFAVAAERGTPEYDKMKEYKKAQREQRDREKTSGEIKEGFWAREAKRSGFAGTGAMFGNGIASVVPLDKPNSRKEK